MNEIESKLRLERDMKMEIINNAPSGRHSISPENKVIPAIKDWEEKFFDVIYWAISVYVLSCL